MQIFGGAEIRGPGSVGGVIDGAVQRHGGPAALEPGEGAGVELTKAPIWAAGLPAGPDWRAPPLLGGQPQRAAEPPHGGAADREGVDSRSFSVDGSH